MTKPTISTFSVTKGARIEETYACFQSWDLASGLDENLRILRETNPILAPTESWLKEMRRIFRVRFGDTARHEPLIRLAKGRMPIREWAPILLWHLCFRELLLSDFLESWLYPRKEEGTLRVRSSDVREYLGGLPARGLLEEHWTENTIDRMASGLPSYAADFGMLEGRVERTILPYHPPEAAILYALHDIAEGTAAPARILEDLRWRRFLLSRADLEHELLRLHQLGRLRFERAGSLIELQLPFPSLDAYVDSLV